MRRIIFPILAVTASASAAAAAEEPAIVITGRGLGAGLGDEVYDIAVIPRERLTHSASNRIEDVLRDVPGFQNFRRSDARSANPTSQGATLRALGGNASSRALLLLDGVPQTDPFGGWIFWPAYDPRRLSSVRVVRGGGSGADGPGALAGTIEMFSAGPGDADGVRGEAAYGSRDGVDAFASYGAHVGQAYLLASGSYGRGDGFIPVVAGQRGPVDRPSPYEQASAALRAVAPIASDVEVQASGLWFSDHRERGLPFSANRTEGADGSLRLVGKGAWRWSLLGYVQTRDYYNSFASTDDARTSASRVAEQYDVPSLGYGARAELRPPLGADAELRIGADWRATDGKTREHANFTAGEPLKGRVAGGETATLGGYAEASWQLAALTVTGGARIDRWHIRDGFKVEQDLVTGIETPEAYADRSGWEPTARAGIAWRPAGAITLRGAAYLGWRLPTLNELYRPFRVGADATAANPALAPERLKGIEAGVDYRPLSTARIGLTVFANRLENGIANVTLGHGPGSFPGVGFVGAAGSYSQRQNLDAITATGIEVDGRLEVGRWFLAGGLSHVTAHVHASGAAAPLDGRRPAQTPRDMLSATLGWSRPNGAWASLTGRYVGGQYEDDLETQKLAGAVTFDAAAVLPVAHGISIEARAENLLDKKVMAGISGDGIVERATPRTVWIGLRFGG
jgi:outer membrane receptor protein involved in Fe transport